MDNRQGQQGQQGRRRGGGGGRIDVDDTTSSSQLPSAATTTATASATITTPITPVTPVTPVTPITPITPASTATPLNHSAQSPISPYNNNYNHHHHHHHMLHHHHHSASDSSSSASHLNQQYSTGVMGRAPSPLSTEHYSPISGSFISDSAVTTTLSSLAIRQQTIEFSYREMSAPSRDMLINAHHGHDEPQQPSSPTARHSSSSSSSYMDISRHADSSTSLGPRVSSISFPAASSTFNNSNLNLHPSVASPPSRPSHHLTVPSSSPHRLATASASSSLSTPPHVSIPIPVSVSGSAQKSSQLSALRQLAKSFEAERLADRLEGSRGNNYTDAAGSYSDTDMARPGVFGSPATHYDNDDDHDGVSSPIAPSGSFEDHTRPHSRAHDFDDGFQAEEEESRYDRHSRHPRHQRKDAKHQRSRSKLGKLFGARPESPYGEIDADRPTGETSTERTPLLGVSSNSGGVIFPWLHPKRRRTPRPHSSPRNYIQRALVSFFSTQTGWLFLQSLPAVVLGLILNLLDALSYGIIIFPSPSASRSIPLHTATQSGISMFLASTVISQFVFALGGSAFKGANGSMMIEVMPFLHIMVRQIESRLIPPDAGDDFNMRPVLATIMVAYAMSTLLTGLVFLVLGCIGGIGWFLFVTGIEVTTGGLKPEFSLDFIHALFVWIIWVLWGSALMLAMLLKLLQTKIHHPLFVPTFYVIVPIAFYAITFGLLHWTVDDMRDRGFLFKMPPGDPVPFYTFWGYFDGFLGVRWRWCFLRCFMCRSCAGFGSVDASGCGCELGDCGHGLSNLAAGLMGTPQNYLVYSNSLLYIRSGGNSTMGGLLLAFATAMIWMFGGGVIGFVPTLVVGSLIFHLAFDLMKESLWDTRLVGISNLEYATILLIVVTMAGFGFTEGILTGMVLACFFFVIMYSRKSIIRSSHTGSEVRSTVHRPYRQKLYLDKVGDQIRIVKLQGFMFFGVISQLEGFLERMLEEVPRIRFVVLEFGLITGVDYSAMEAFFADKATSYGKECRDLAMSGIFDTDDEIHDIHDHQLHSQDPHPAELEPHQRHHHALDSHISDDHYEIQPLAPSWTPLRPTPPRVRAAVECEEGRPRGRVWAVRRGKEEEEEGRREEGREEEKTSPRMSQARSAAYDILHDDPNIRPTGLGFLPPASAHPVATLLCSFADASTWMTNEDLEKLAERFERMEMRSGTVLWTAGSRADAIYVVERGELAQVVVGELELVSGRTRACRLVVEEQAVVWRLTKDGFEEMCVDEPRMSLAFLRVALGFDCLRFSSSLGHQRQ
ncbi:hypothetical protein BC829DRAFT_417082 [Chytridium lagenaria]|nr:hypothetical protein BC829DRAFT_417082 [Chytridium lagenaria]